MTPASDTTPQPGSFLAMSHSLETIFLSSCPDTFLEFLGAVRESGSLESSCGPAVVHCSAGIGRSGSFVLVDSCLLEAENGGPEAVNIKQRLLDMRSFRMGLIRTDDQLKFSYQAIIEVSDCSCRTAA